MRYLKNRAFQRSLKDHNLNDDDIKEILDNIFKGRAIALGNKIYKIRVSAEGRGKSGGFRTIFFWKKDELIIFCFLYSKNVQEGLNFNAQKTLAVWSKEYEELTAKDIEEAKIKDTFWEIEYEKEC